MARYVWTDAGFMDKKTGAPMMKPYEGEVVCPAVLSDLPAYYSVASGKWVDGRSDRREDLKRTGCREVEPGEFKPQYRSKANAVKNGGEWNPDAGKSAPKFTGFLK